MKVILAILLLSLATAIDIPPMYPGYRVNKADLFKVRIDVYLDLLCSDCKAAHPYLNSFMNSQASDGTDIDRLVELYIHFFPLPYHHHAHITTKPVFLVWSKTHDGRKMNDYATWLLNNQNTFLTYGKDLTESQVISKICDMS